MADNKIRERVSKFPILPCTCIMEVSAMKQKLGVFGSLLHSMLKGTMQLCTTSKELLLHKLASNYAGWTCNDTYTASQCIISKTQTPQFLSMADQIWRWVWVLLILFGCLTLKLIICWLLLKIAPIYFFINKIWTQAHWNFLC